MGIILLYALLGFVLAPYLLERTLQNTLRDQFGAELRAENIDINPFALSLRVNGLELDNPEGQPTARERLGGERLGGHGRGVDRVGGVDGGAQQQRDHGDAPEVGSERPQAKQVACGSSLRQVGVALGMYADGAGDVYPAWSSWHVWGYFGTTADGTAGDNPGPAWSEQLRDDP